MALCAAISSVMPACGSRRSNLIGQIQWVNFRATNAPGLDSLEKIFGAAFLLLEEHYASLGYKGPPEGYPKTPAEVTAWKKRMPEEWWTSISYEWRGRDSGIEPRQVTLPLDIPVPLLRAHLDSSGRFEFQGLPLGRHTLFIRWGNSPDPQNNISGPYEVIIDKPGRIERVFRVNPFDMIDT